MTAPTTSKPLSKKQIRIGSKEVCDFMLGIKEKTGEMPTFRTAALHFMPNGIKWFESGADYAFGFWLNKLVLEAARRRNHVVATYTFDDKKARF